MKLRWAVVLSGMAAAAVGGALAGVPAMLALQQAEFAAGSAPSRHLEVSRRAVLTSTEGVIVDLGRRTEQLNMLSELLAEAAGEDSWRPLGAGGVSFTPSERRRTSDAAR